MLAVPLVVAAKVTEHDADAPVPEIVHGLPVNAPVTPVCVNVTVPVGAVELALVSVTVTVQMEAWFTNTGVSQMRLVLVD